MSKTRVSSDVKCINRQIIDWNAECAVQGTQRDVPSVGSNDDILRMVLHLFLHEFDEMASEHGVLQAHMIVDFGHVSEIGGYGAHELLFKRAIEQSVKSKFVV